MKTNAQPVVLLAALLVAGGATQATADFITDWVLETPDPRPGQDLVFSITMTEDPVEAYLYYRVDGGDFVQVSLNDKDGGVFTTGADDPATTDGCLVEWYVYATHMVVPDDRAPDSGYESFTVTHVDEAVGVYFGQGFNAEYDVTGMMGENVRVRLVLRYPHLWEAKALGYVSDWKLSLSVDGTHTLTEDWTLDGSGVNEGDPPMTIGDITLYFFDVNVSAGPLTMSPLGPDAIELGHAYMLVDPTTRIDFRIGPLQGDDAPLYRPDAAVAWREVGTAGGGDPNDPAEDWGDICAQMNGPGGIVQDRASTWGGVKALFR